MTDNILLSHVNPNGYTSLSTVDRLSACGFCFGRADADVHCESQSDHRDHRNCIAVEYPTSEGSRRIRQGQNLVHVCQ